MHQVFRFKFDSTQSVRAFLLGLASNAVLLEDRGDFLAFGNRPNESSFTFDCEIVPDGLVTGRHGEYFSCLGVFIEALTGQFGAVTVEDV